MPVQVTYPGVYIEELPSGSHTINGVPTSITTFLGRAPKGLTNEPVLIQSMAEFQSLFGGLDRHYPMSYAVNDFFLNGGVQALIIRLFNGMSRDGVTSSVEWEEKEKEAATTLLATISGSKAKTSSDLEQSLTAQIESLTKTYERQVGEQIVNQLEKQIQSGADVKGIQEFFKGKNPDDYTSTFPLPQKAPLSINSYEWRAAVDAAQQVVVTAFDSLFDGRGNPLPNRSTGQTIFQLAQSEARFISSSGSKAEGAAARSVLANFPKVSESDTVRTTLDKLFKRVSEADGIENRTLVAALQTAVINILTTCYNPDGNSLKADLDIDTLQAQLSAALGDVKNPDKTAVNQNPGQLIVLDNASIKALFDSAFMGIGYAAAALPENLQLPLEAMDEGSWGGYLEASVDTDGINKSVAKQYEQYGLVQTDLFNLTVIYNNPNGSPVQERFTNITIKAPTSEADPNYIEPPNRLDKVLENSSTLVRVAQGKHAEIWQSLPSVPPPAGALGKSSKAQDSLPLTSENYLGDPEAKTGLYALEKTELFNLLCIPPDVITPNWIDIDELVLQTAAVYCMKRRAFLIVDPPSSDANSWLNKLQNGNIDHIKPTDLGIDGESARYAAVYFPLVMAEDPLLHNQVRPFPVSPIIAGIMAKTDLERGVWKAPAGLDAAIQGIKSLQYNLNDSENGVLNVQGINCLRHFNPGGPVVWGARTLRGQDALSDDYKYVPVRRLVNYIELSLQQGTKWAVFEPNDEQLWSALRVSIGGFMKGLMTQGAILQYQVVCDNKTTTLADIQKGVVNVLIRFSPVEPAEFIVLQFQIEGLQSAG